MDPVQPVLAVGDGQGQRHQLADATGEEIGPGPPLGPLAHHVPGRRVHRSRRSGTRRCGWPRCACVGTCWRSSATIWKAASSARGVVAVGGQQGFDGLPDVLDPLPGHHRPGQRLVPAADQAHQDQAGGDLDQGPVGGDPAEGPVEVVLVRGGPSRPAGRRASGGGLREAQDPAPTGEGQDVPDLAPHGTAPVARGGRRPDPGPVPRPGGDGGPAGPGLLMVGEVADRPNLPSPGSFVTRLPFHQSEPSGRTRSLCHRRVRGVRAGCSHGAAHRFRLVPGAREGVRTGPVPADGGRGDRWGSWRLLSDSAPRRDPT